MSELDFRRKIRESEMGTVLSLLKTRGITSGRLLEVGAGAGWQSKLLAEAGYQVSAIDLPCSNFKEVRCFGITDYDGEHIPFPDEHFDVIFSSNVLEHVLKPQVLAAEMLRCLKKNGVQIHLVPSGGWRFWTNLTHWPGLLLKMRRRRLSAPSIASSASASAAVSKRKFLAALLPGRHGETGSSLSEIWWFSRWGWQQHFVRWKLNMERVGSTGLIYTGYKIFDGKLSLAWRRLFAYVLGSSCHIYVSKKS
jgi:SAM-dependent methyltransferase